MLITDENLDNDVFDDFGQVPNQQDADFDNSENQRHCNELPSHHTSVDQQNGDDHEPRSPNNPITIGLNDTYMEQNSASIKNNHNNKPYQS